MADVLFISMPFGSVFTPSIGLSLLQAELAHAGIASDIAYFSIQFAERIGSRLYTAISQSNGVPIVDLAGEWIFSAGLTDHASGNDDTGYVNDVLRARSEFAVRRGMSPLRERTIAAISRARELAGPFLDRCVAEVVRRSPRVIGLTSSFQQHAASLALARRLKDALPAVPIVMGGANCESIMGAETLRQFPFVDAVVSGEADLIIVDLVQRLLGGRALDDIPGVRTRSALKREFAFGRFTNAPIVRDMDALPYPDYHDYIRQFESSRLSRSWRPNMLFESSRGCWWGEKAHCTFCGLNGSTMTFRSKSADRALAELEHLATVYRGCDVQVVDNILEMSYFGTVLPQLAKRRLKLDLFYETKANLKKEQIRQLAAARVTRIQPGIESFSDPVLALMRKGVTWLQNVQLLKWCKQFGVHPYWNVIWGFPGEPVAEYGRVTRLVPQLTHLPAPVGGSNVRLDRFSPNFEQADQLGFARLRPIEPYLHIFKGLTDQAIANLAYYFNFDYADGRDTRGYSRPLRVQLTRWKHVHARSELVSARDGDRLLLFDLRPGRRARTTVLCGLDRALYEACDAVTHVRRLVSIASPDSEATEAEASVAQRLTFLVERGLLVTDGQRYLALAIPLGEYRPSPAVRARIRALTRRVNRQRWAHKRSGHGEEEEEGWQEKGGQEGKEACASREEGPRPDGLHEQRRVKRVAGRAGTAFS